MAKSKKALAFELGEVVAIDMFELYKDEINRGPKFIWPPSLYKCTASMIKTQAFCYNIEKYEEIAQKSAIQKLNELLNEIK